MWGDWLPGTALFFGEDGLRGLCKHAVISLVASLRLAVSCAVDTSSCVFLECSLRLTVIELVVYMCN